jgi:4-hydroxy-tetrahydrodipicolinate reductase
MNIILVGYGRMGREIEAVLVQRGHTVVSRVDASGLGDVREISDDGLAGADGVIEFALADGIADRITAYAKSGKPVVIGTTGWQDIAEEAKMICEKEGGSILWGSNFSVGAHLFFRLTAAAAKLVNRTEEYDVALVEYHHNKKSDYPSGTAITAAEGILDSLERKTSIMKDLPGGPIPSEALQVVSVRVGSVPGIHEMRMDSPDDFLTIRHEARGRGGFALGAVRGLEWLEGRRGWHAADEFIDELLTGEKR